MNPVLVLKAAVSILALYAAANPWLRHHNVAHPADVLAALGVFLTGLFSVRTGSYVPIAIATAAGILLAAAGRAIALARGLRPFVIFGAVAANDAAVAAIVSACAEAAGIEAAALRHDSSRPWLYVLAGVSGKAAATLGKALDKALRKGLGLSFRRWYPATLAVLAFLAALWRYL